MGASLKTRCSEEVQLAYMAYLLLIKPTVALILFFEANPGQEVGCGLVQVGARGKIVSPLFNGVFVVE